MIQCPCGSQNDYLSCCGLFIDNQENAPSPEALMRSRYTAYTLARIDYISKTMVGRPSEEFNEANAEKWAKQVNWKGLKILSSAMDEDDINIGYVEFSANFIELGKKQNIHELSKFKRIDGKWFYVEALSKTIKLIKKTKPSLNAPCPCGSQKKYKNCHGMTKK